MRRTSSVIGLLLLAATSAQAAPADYTVESSSAPTLKAGQTLAKGTAIDIPANNEVTLIDRTGASVAQRVCVGAYRGPVEACTGKTGCSTLNRMLGLCHGSGSESGGVEAGAVRGAPSKK